MEKICGAWKNSTILTKGIDKKVDVLRHLRQFCPLASQLVAHLMSIVYNG